MKSPGGVSGARYAAKPSFNFLHNLRLAKMRQKCLYSFSFKKQTGSRDISDTNNLCSKISTPTSTELNKTLAQRELSYNLRTIPETVLQWRSLWSFVVNCELHGWYVIGEVIERRRPETSPYNYITTSTFGAKHSLPAMGSNRLGLFLSDLQGQTLPSGGPLGVYRHKI